MEVNKIFEIIRESQKVPDWVVNARNYNKDLDALVNGVNFKELLIRIEHKEDAEKQEARKRYSRSIKDMFERLLRSIDNVYSATGGVKKYPDKTEEVIKKISQIRDGKTLEKWLQTVWMSLYHTDPNGVIIYEWKDNNFYPCYKSIHGIRNYEADGQRINWLLYEATYKDNKCYWRFIDEEKDYTILDVNGNYEIVEEYTYLNPFKKVPGVVISDIVKIGSKQRLTPIDSIIELAKEFLRDQSIKTIFKFLHGFPIFWRYAIQCPKCQGAWKKGDSVCPDCVDGFLVKRDITDCASLPVPDKDSPVIAPNIAGFIAPDLATWNQYSEELKLLYSIIFETIWGVDAQIQVQKTATEIFLNTQPLKNKLHIYADVAQWVEWYMTDLAMEFMNPLRKKEDTAIILYGRNYIIDSEETLLKKYETGKEQEDNSAILDRLLFEWMLSKYKNDPITMNEEVKRLKVEPFIHYSVEQIKTNYGEAEAKQKMLFGNWWNNIADKSKQPEALVKEFETYYKLKLNI